MPFQPCILLLSCHRHTSQMDIWRYRGPDVCEHAVTVNIPLPFGVQRRVHGNYIRGVYAACVAPLCWDMLIVYLVNWLDGSQFSFKFKAVRTIQKSLHNLTGFPSPAMPILVAFSRRQSYCSSFKTRTTLLYTCTQYIHSNRTWTARVTTLHAAPFT